MDRRGRIESGRRKPESTIGVTAVSFLAATTADLVCAESTPQLIVRVSNLSVLAQTSRTDKFPALPQPEVKRTEFEKSRKVSASWGASVVPRT